MQKLLLLLILFLSFGSLTTGSPNVVEDITEYDLKAVLLVKLTRFIEWPSSQPPPKPPEAKGKDEKRPSFKLGVVGTHGFGNRLEKVFKKNSIDGRPVVVLYFKTVDDLEAVDLLYVSSDAASAVHKIRNQFSGTGTLLVGESTGFAKETGHLNLYKRSGSIRFEAHRKRLKQDKFIVSSKLLRLARIVKS